MTSRGIAALTFAAAIAPLPALAHHPMGGASAATIWEGIASGVAHPVIGLDHLAFLLAAGILAAVAPRRVGLAALPAFLGAGLAGALMHLGAIGLGAVEALVALSVLLAGIALLAGPRLLAAAAPAGFALAFAGAGLVHGHALAEAVDGSPAITVAAYLLTLAVTQGAIAGGVLLAWTRWARDGAAPQRLVAGMGTAAFGAVTLAYAIA